MGIPTSQYLAQKEQAQLTEKEKNLHFLEIDGQKIGGYGTYSFYIQKTYAKEPTRSSAGSIDNLDSYSTFLTPTVKIKFNALSLQQYQKIIQIIHSKNEHRVRCYDIVYDTERTFNAYFAPDDYPELFILDFDVVAVLNYEIELIGTNTSLDKCSITYHLNDPNNVTIKTHGSDDYNVGQEVIIGKGAEEIKKLEGYTFDRWYTKQDKEAENGVWYVDGQAMVLSNDLVLYAQWLDQGKYVLSYDYGIGEIPVDAYGKQIISTEISKDSAITYTSTKAKEVEYNGVKYNPYESPKWYWQSTPTLNAEDSSHNSTEIISGETLYNVVGNATIYQYFQRQEYTVTYSMFDGSDQVILRGKYGDTVAMPVPPEGSKWVVGEINGERLADDEYFDFNGTIPPANIFVAIKEEND